VAALTVDVIAAAASVRNESRRLRRRSESGRLELRRRRRDAALLQARCLAAYARLSTTRAVQQPSPWSELPWHLPDRELDRILLPL